MLLYRRTLYTKRYRRQQKDDMLCSLQVAAVLGGLPYHFVMQRWSGVVAGHLRYILIASVTRRASGCWWRRQTRAWSSCGCRSERPRRDWWMPLQRRTCASIILHRDGLCSKISLRNNYYYVRTFMPKDNQWQVKGVIYYTFVYLRFLLRYLQVVSNKWWSPYNSQL